MTPQQEAALEVRRCLAHKLRIEQFLIREDGADPAKALNRATAYDTALQDLAVALDALHQHSRRRSA